MLSADFYEIFINYDYLLICHFDAWVFKDDITYWENLEYDHVAAPWPLPPSYKCYPQKIYLLFEKYIIQSPHYLVFDKIGNGGFSLRRTKFFRDYCKNHLQEITHHKKPNGTYENEDIFWAIHAKGITTPPLKKAYNFAFDCKPDLGFTITNHNLPMAAHGFKRSHFFYKDYIPKEAFEE